MLPRNIKLINGKYEFNGITNNLDMEDKLLFSNVISRKILSGDIYPLIFDDDLEFLSDFIEDQQKYHKLSRNKKNLILIGLRDLYWANNENLLSGEEEKLFKNAVDLIDDEFLKIDINNLTILPHPTKHFKMAKFIQCDLEPVISQYFINNCDYYLVFCDPCELSYHNFENIIDISGNINLDHIVNTNRPSFYSNFERKKYVPVELAEGIYKIPYFGTRALNELDELNLYTKPLNDKVRGGKRCIFRSENMAYKLTRALRKRFDDKKCCLRQLHEGFIQVNEIFRLNKFRKDDEKFYSHYDTPYLDASKKMCSKYTILIYISDGKGKDILKIGDMSINEMNIGDCIIFDQKYEHEGNPYDEGDKIFIRSELIYMDANMDYDKEIAKIFNIGCYMTKQSTFDGELQKYASDAYNHVVKMRYKYKTPLFRTKLLHKLFRGVNFITNGNDYWYPKAIDLKHAVMITITDYFGGKYNLNKTNTNESVKLLNFDVEDDDSIFCYLTKLDMGYKEEVINKLKWKKLEKYVNDYFEGYSDEEDKIDKYDNKPNRKPIERRKIDYDEKKYTDSWDYEHSIFPHCCPFHTQGPIDPRKCKDVMDCYNVLVKSNNDLMNRTTVAIFDGRIIINMDDIEITKNKIKFKSDNMMHRINFAACWNCDNDPRDFILEGKNITSFKIPDIDYCSTEKGVKCRLICFMQDK